MRRLSFWLAAALVASGCEKEARPEGAAPPPARYLSAFSPTECKPSSVPTRPPIGAHFTYQPVDADGRDLGAIYSETIIEHGPRSAVSQTEVFAHGKDDPGRFRTAYEGGLVPATAGEALNSGGRVYTFPSEAVEVVWGLKVGETVRFSGSEISKIRGIDKTLRGNLTVTLRACGQLKVATRREAVHVFEVTDFRRSVRTKANGTIDDGVIAQNTLFYVSDRLGWYLAQQSAEGALNPLSAPG